MCRRNLLPLTFFLNVEIHRSYQRPGVDCKGDEIILTFFGLKWHPSKVWIFYWKFVVSVFVSNAIFVLVFSLQWWMAWVKNSKLWWNTHQVWRFSEPQRPVPEVLLSLKNRSDYQNSNFSITITPMWVDASTAYFLAYYQCHKIEVWIIAQWVNAKRSLVSVLKV